MYEMDKEAESAKVGAGANALPNPGVGPQVGCVIDGDTVYEGKPAATLNFGRGEEYVLKSELRICPFGPFKPDSPVLYTNKQTGLTHVIRFKTLTWQPYHVDQDWDDNNLPVIVNVYDPVSEVYDNNLSGEGSGDGGSGDGGSDDASSGDDRDDDDDDDYVQENDDDDYVQENDDDDYVQENVDLTLGDSDAGSQSSPSEPESKSTPAPGAAQPMKPFNVKEFETVLAKYDVVETHDQVYYNFVKQVCTGYHATGGGEDFDPLHEEREMKLKSVLSDVYRTMPATLHPHKGEINTAYLAVLPIVQEVFQMPDMGPQVCMYVS